MSSRRRHRCWSAKRPDCADQRGHREKQGHGSPVAAHACAPPAIAAIVGSPKPPITRETRKAPCRTPSQTPRFFRKCIGRGERIRTSGPCLPKVTNSLLSIENIGIICDPLSEQFKNKTRFFRDFTGVARDRHRGLISAIYHAIGRDGGVVALAGAWPIAVTAAGGVLHSVIGKEGDTLESLAATFDLTAEDISTAVTMARAFGFALDLAFQRVCP